LATNPLSAEVPGNSRKSCKSIILLDKAVLDGP
jgi:hypothetical protein